MLEQILSQEKPSNTTAVTAGILAGCVAGASSPYTDLPSKKESILLEIADLSKALDGLWAGIGELAHTLAPILSLKNDNPTTETPVTRTGRSQISSDLRCHTARVFEITKLIQELIRAVDL